MKFVAGLTCHLCGAAYPAEALWVCSECLGPLEVTYDYAFPPELAEPCGCGAPSCRKLIVAADEVAARG